MPRESLIFHPCILKITEALDCFNVHITFNVVQMSMTEVFVTVYVLGVIDIEYHVTMTRTELK